MGVVIAGIGRPYTHGPIWKMTWYYWKHSNCDDEKQYCATLYEIKWICYIIMWS